MLGGGSPSSCRRMKKLEEEEGMAGGAAAQVAAPSPGLWRRVYGASGWAGPETVGWDVPLSRSRTLGPGAVDDGSPEMTGGGAAGDSRLLPLGTDGCCSGSSTAPQG